MFEKLRQTENRFITIEKQLEDPGVLSDVNAYTRLLKERRELEPVITAYRNWQAAVHRIEEAESLLDSGDSELRELAQDELREAKEAEASTQEELKILLLPRDPNDDRNVMMEIRSGIGGEEAALFAADLFRMYSMYAAAHGFKMSLLSCTETELGGYKEAVIMIEGEGAYSKFKFEGGVHRVQRVPRTESQGRLQTSTATVAVLPEAEDVEIEIRPDDLIFESCKSSGAGGQHINKTESAVRITHKPTGIVVWCQEERSQTKNKDKALKMLKTRLYNIKMNEQTSETDSARKAMVGTGERSEKIRTYNFPQNRVTDHRINLSLYHLDEFMNGHIEEMIEALLTAETAAKLASAQEVSE